MVKPGDRRDVARWLVTDHGLSKRRAARCCSISSGCYRYTSRRKPDDQILDVLTRLASSRPRWEFGLMFDWVRLHGFDWNHKRVYRVYRELELNLRIKPQKTLPIAESHTVGRSPEAQRLLVLGLHERQPDGWACVPDAQRDR